MPLFAHLVQLLLQAFHTGNYVCHLNSYRNQGVSAYPGLEFFSLVGALVVLPIENTRANVLNSSLQLPADEYSTQILSPDLGPSPKPLANRDFVIPKGAVIYSSAVSVVNLEEATAAGTTTVKVTGIAAGDQVTLTADSNGTFNECGARFLDLDFATAAASSGPVISVGKKTRPILVISLPAFNSLLCTDFPGEF